MESKTIDLKLGKLEGIRKMLPILISPTTVTANGNQMYDIFDFKEENIDINFIAMSLSKICRYIGHTGEDPSDFLSVAQHSHMMAEAILLVTGDPCIAMEALLHDSPEAYIGDIMSPLKKQLKEIKEIEDNIERIIFNHYGLPFPMNPLVKHVDINICEYELTFAVHNQDVNKFTFDFWTPEDSYFKFMAMFDRLTELIRIKNFTRAESVYDQVKKLENLGTTEKYIDNPNLKASQIQQGEETNIIKNKSEGVDMFADMKKTNIEENASSGMVFQSDNAITLKNFLIWDYNGLAIKMLVDYLGFTLETKSDEGFSPKYILVNPNNKTMKGFYTPRPKGLKEDMFTVLEALDCYNQFGVYRNELIRFAKDLFLIDNSKKDTLTLKLDEIEYVITISDINKASFHELILILKKLPL